MIDSRFARAQALFTETVDLPAPERDAALAHACDGDEDLLTLVLSMIEEDARGRSILDDGLAATARRVLDGEAAFIEQIGPYRMVRVLGEGGMGVVYLAERTDLGSYAAIKLLRDAWVSPARRARFTLEQRTLARLTHPAIARLFDAGTLADGTPWIVMEYVDGVPITDYCRDHNLTIVERLTLLRTVADAVQHAHRHLIIHRDLKPSNVLVTAEGVAKLLDFGIAKQLASGMADPLRTRTGMAMLTPAYAAPEQIRGEGLGLHSDVYGLGALAYELITGQPPFDLSNLTPGQAERLILEEEPTRPSVMLSSGAGGAVRPHDAKRLGGTARADLDVLCAKALHKEAGRRYQSVDAFARDIDHYLHGEPLEGRPDALGYRAAKFARRHRTPLAAGAAALLGGIGLTAFYLMRLRQARDAALVETARAQRLQHLMLTLFTGGERSTAPAESLRVADVLDRGVLEAQALTAEPAVQADLYETLGTLYRSLGRLADAEPLLESSLERRAALFGSDSAEAGRSLIALALLRLDQSRFEDAEQLARDGLALAQQTLPAGITHVGRATTVLGRVLEERGHYALAIRELESAVGILSAASDASADLAESLRHLGNAQFYTGHFDEAGAIFDRVLAMTRQVNGERHALVAEDLINVGAVHFERGRYAEAERFYREALPITEGWYGKDHHQTASNLTMLARALHHQQEYDEALQLLRRAVAIQERVFGPVHARVASAVNELGHIARARQQYDEAEAAFLRMGEIYRAIYPNKHYLTATATSNLASVYSAKEEHARAEPLFREAIALYSDTQSPEHLNTGIARIKLGGVLLRQGRHAEAEEELLHGYGIVSAQTSPRVRWLKTAREDLVALYTATGQAERADRFRSEQEELA